MGTEPLGLSAALARLRKGEHGEPALDSAAAGRRDAFKACRQETRDQPTADLWTRLQREHAEQGKGGVKSLRDVALIAAHISHALDRWINDGEDLLGIHVGDETS